MDSCNRNKNVNGYRFIVTLRFTNIRKMAPSHALNYLSNQSRSLNCSRFSSLSVCRGMKSLRVFYSWKSPNKSHLLFADPWRKSLEQLWTSCNEMSGSQLLPDRQQQDIALTRSPSIPLLKFFGLRTHPGPALANRLHYAATSVFRKNQK